MARERDEPAVFRTGRDRTPEALRPLLDQEIPGFGEQFRAVSVEESGTAGYLSRSFAGLANRTLVFGLPGSPGPCRTGWDRVQAEQLDTSAPTCNMVTLLPRLGER